MKHRAQLLAIVGLLAVGSISIPSDPVSTRTGLDLVGIGSLNEHQIHGGTDWKRAKVRYSIALYARAGLFMPRLDIYIHDSYEGCMGHGGLFNKDGSGLRIDLCDDLVLHELAHAWEYHNVSDEVRQAFLEHTGLPTWDGQAYDHHERAVEAAAWAISYGIEPHPATARSAEPDVEELSRYELLVGKPSPRAASLVAPAPGGAGATGQLSGGLPHYAE